METMNNMVNLENSEIKKEFHKLMVFQHGKPKISLETENPNQIKLLLDRQFTIIKEYIKLYFKETFGFFPSHSEGNCKDCSQKLIQILNGELVWGWFITDREIEAEDIKVPTKYGYSTLTDTNGKDRKQLSHWWVEIGNVVIDLTVEQFNRFLADDSEKYLPIEVISKDSPKAQRYIGKERYKDGGKIEDDCDEEEEPDWEDDDGEWNKREE